MEKFSNRSQWPCVRRLDVPSLVFCGRVPSMTEWCFANPEHVLECEEQSGGAVACPVCAAVIIDEGSEEADGEVHRG